MIKILKKEIEQNKYCENIISSKNINNNNTFLDIIYCSINFLIFYHDILFQKIYQENFINIFIDLCNILYNLSLIYS